MNLPRHRLLGIAILCLAAGSSSLALQTRGRNVSEGVYTDQQATRGQGLYNERCASCHGNNLVGRSGPPLTGSDFLANWQKEPLLDLANKILRTMPKNEPPKLTAQETADVLAYVLQVGKFPSGRTELAMDEAALKQVS